MITYLRLRYVLAACGPVRLVSYSATSFSSVPSLRVVAQLSLVTVFLFPPLEAPSVNCQ